MCAVCLQIIGKVFLFQLIQITSFGCVSHVSFYYEVMIICVLPIGIIALLWLIYLLLPKLSHRDPIKTRSTQNFIVKLIFMFITLMYPAISIEVFQLYVCQYIAGVYYLEADYSLECLFKHTLHSVVYLQTCHS